MKIYLGIQFTYKILGIDFFVKFFFDIILTLFLSFYDFENKTSGSVENPSWLYQESVMALEGVRHGSGRNPSPLETGQ